MRDTPFRQHAKIDENTATLAMIVHFIQFTGTTWYRSRRAQAEAFSSLYAPDRRAEIVKSVLIVMDNYGIDGELPPRSVDNAWNLAMDSVGIDVEELDREREILKAIERGDPDHLKSW